MKLTPKSYLLTGICALSMTISAPSHAGLKLLLHAENTSAQSYSGTTNLKLIPAGATHGLFWSPHNKHIIVLFNAECQVSSSTKRSWVDVNIWIEDPTGQTTRLSPSDSDNALCSGDGDPNGSPYVSASTNAYYRTTTKGVHTIWVETKFTGPSGSYRIDDTSLIVMR